MDSECSIPALPGSYALHLRLEQAATLQIGRLCEVCFSPGGYI